MLLEADVLEQRRLRSLSDYRGWYFEGRLAGNAVLLVVIRQYRELGNLQTDMRDAERDRRLL